MFVEGMLESGEFEDDAEAEAEVDDDDRDTIMEWIGEQLSAVDDFAAAAYKVSKLPSDDDATESAEQGIVNRAQMWADSFGGLGNLGKMSALKKEMGVWKLGATEVHCKSDGDTYGCANLDGKAHPLKWYMERGLNPGTPGSMTTCGGFNCDCTIVNRKGKVLIG